MKFLLVYPNQKAVGVKPVGLSVLKAGMARHGHQLQIFDVSRYDLEGDEREVKEDLHIFRKLAPGEKLPERARGSFADVCRDLFAAIDRFRPDMVGASTLTANYHLARELMRAVKDKYPLPVIVGGIHATLCAEEVISEPFVDGVCIGEADESLAELAQNHDAGRDWSATPGFWCKRANGTIARNPVREPNRQLDALPFPDWDDFSDLQFYKPYHGRVYRMGDVERSRGCPYQCSYCAAPALTKMLHGGRPAYRQKSNDRLLAELVWLKEKYKIEFWRFWDESFLLLPEADLADLAERYAAEVRLPFLFETTAESVTESKAKLLARMGCVAVRIGVETGNEWLRREVLNKPTTNNEYRRAFALLQREGISAGAYNMIGLPEETRAMIMETIRFNRELRSADPGFAIFYPYPGSALYELCVARELLAARPAAMTDVHFTSPLASPGLDAAEVRRLQRTVFLYLNLPEYLYPLLDRCGREGSSLSRLLTRLLTKLASRLKYGGNDAGA